MVITKTLNIYYRDYVWFSEEAKYFLTESELDQNESCILIDTVDVAVDVVDMEANPEYHRQKQIAILQAKQEKVREAALKELQGLEERIQTLRGINYISEVGLV